jgi:hypothetical protein
MFTADQVQAYAKDKGYAPGTILWATDKPLSEGAFRSGSKTTAAIDFLRWQDIGLELTKGLGRIPPRSSYHMLLHRAVGFHCS